MRFVCKGLITVHIFHLSKFRCVGNPHINSETLYPNYVHRSGYLYPLKDLFLDVAQKKNCWPINKIRIWTARDIVHA